MVLHSQRGKSWGNRSRLSSGLECSLYSSKKEREDQSERTGRVKACRSADWVSNRGIVMNEENGIGDLKEKLPLRGYAAAFSGYTDRWRTLTFKGKCHNCDELITETTCAGQIDRIGNVCENCWKQLTRQTAPQGL